MTFDELKTLLPHCDPGSSLDPAELKPFTSTKALSLVVESPKSYGSAVEVPAGTPGWVHVAEELEFSSYNKHHRPTKRAFVVSRTRYFEFLTIVEVDGERQVATALESKPLPIIDRHARS